MSDRRHHIIAISGGRRATIKHHRGDQAILPLVGSRAAQNEPTDPFKIISQRSRRIPIQFHHEHDNHFLTTIVLSIAAAQPAHSTRLQL